VARRHAVAGVLAAEEHQAIPYRGQVVDRRHHGIERVDELSALRGQVTVEHVTR